MRHAGGKACGKRLSAISVDHVPATTGGIAAYQSMGLYVQNRCLCLAETEQEKSYMVLWAGLLDTGQRGNLPACQTWQAQTPQRRYPPVYCLPGERTQQKAGRDP